MWYGGEPAGLKEYVFSQWPRVNRYPEVLAESLAARAAAHHGVPAGQVDGAGNAIEEAGVIGGVDRDQRRAALGIGMGGDRERRGACVRILHQ